MRKVMIAAAALCACGIAAASAPAAGKERVFVERFSVPYEFTVDCAPYGHDFDILVSGEEHGTVTDVYDSDGTLLQTVFKRTLEETDTNSLTGAVLPLRGRAKEVLDHVERTRTITGSVYVGHQNGEGTYLLDAGRITMTLEKEPLFVAGPKEGFFGNLDQIVCDALAEA